MTQWLKFYTGCYYCTGRLKSSSVLWSLLLHYWCFFFLLPWNQFWQRETLWIKICLKEEVASYILCTLFFWGVSKEKRKRRCSSRWCLTFHRLKAAAWCTATGGQTDTSNGQKNGSTTAVNNPLSLVHKRAPVHQRHIFTVQQIPFFKHILVIHQHAFLF